VGALSVASTIISYLANSHDKKINHMGSAVTFKRETKKVRIEENEP